MHRLIAGGNAHVCFSAIGSGGICRGGILHRAAHSVRDRLRAAAAAARLGGADAVVGCAPEWMSEKAVSIGNYVVGTGIDTFLGVDPYVSGSSEMCELLTEGTRKWTGAAYTVETDIEKLTDLMIERIEEKRTALGI